MPNHHTERDSLNLGEVKAWSDMQNGIGGVRTL